MKNENDNYSKLADYWKSVFASMQDTRGKASSLGITAEADGSALITYFGRKYRLDLDTGDIHPESSGDVPVFDAMFIYHLFWFSSEHPTISGVFVPFRDVRGAAVFEPAFKKSAIDRLTKTFSGKTALFIAACESLGGRRLPYGDAGYAINVFGSMELELIFWDGDDEFPPSANILFDKNITQFTHVETAVQVGVDGVSAVIAAAGL